MYFDFLPMYETCTKLGKTLGQTGREIIRDGMRDIRCKLLASHKQSDARVGIFDYASLPQTNISRRYKRKTKVSSPAK